MDKIQQLSTWFTTRKLSGKLAIGCGGLLVLFCLCSIPIAILSPSTQTLKVQNTSIAQVETSPISSQTEIVAEVPTSAPTDTPESTNTPLPPPPTQNPNLIMPGTYLVGADIKPGIYKGEAGSDMFSSCYWGRLKDLSGSLEALLANDNSIGQFYIEIRDSDYALETRCQLVPLDSIPANTGELSQIITAGTYIVGKDIQAGTYKGQAGTDITTSCYWGRLSNVAGGLDAIIANDNAIGQFYVQVTGTDFALSTHCELERVGD